MSSRINETVSAGPGPLASAPGFSARARNMSLVASVCVVLIHAGAGGMGSFVAKALHQLFGWGVCTFAVPWFFFASGCFFATHLDEKGWWHRAVVSRLSSLLVPALLWSALYGVFLWTLDPTAAARVGLTLFGLDPWRHPALVPLWYVRALLVIVVGSPPLVAALRRRPLACVTVLAAALYYCCGLHSRLAHPWRVFYSLFSVTGWLWFSLGVVVCLPGAFADRLRRLAVRDGGLWPWAATAAAGVLVGRFAQAAGWQRTADVLWLTAIPPLLLTVWRLVPTRPWPGRLVRMAFPIYVLHYFFEHLFERTLLPLSSPSCTAYILRFVLVLSLSWATSAALLRHCPTFARILFGGRARAEAPASPN